MAAWLMRLWERYPLCIALSAKAAFEVIIIMKTGLLSGEPVLHDTDTLMRLVIARNMHETGQRSVVFMRENPPSGVHLTWSSLLCWVILGAARLFWSIPPDQAMGLVAVFIGPAFAIAIMLVAYWSARPLMRPQLAAAFSLAVIFGPIVSWSTRAGIVNHHAVMILVSTMLLGTAIRCDQGRASSRLLACAGLAAGLGFWISFEELPLIELFCIYLLILWAVQGSSRFEELLVFGTAFCVTSLVALLIDPPYGGYASVELDRVSLPYVFGIGLQLGCLVMIRLYCPSTIRGRLAWLAVLGGVITTIEYMVYPMVFAGPQSQIDSFLKSQWMYNIWEVSPVVTISDAIKYLGNGLIGVAALLLMQVKPRWKNWFCLICLAAFCLLAQQHVRASIYASTAGSLAAFVALQRANTAWEISHRHILSVLTAPVAIALVLGCTIIGNRLHIALQPLAPYSLAQCDYSRVLPVLRDRTFLGTDKPDPVFVTELDKSPALLFYTSYRTLAANYFADSVGLNDSFLMMRDMGWNTARSVVKTHDISYFLLCPTSDGQRYGTFGLDLYWKYSTPQKEFRQPTFYTRIMDGTLPPWLIQRQWPEGVRTDLKLFQVVTPPATP